VGRYELRPEEVEVLRAILEAVVIERSSGLIGVKPGHHFQTTSYGIAPRSLPALDALAKKVGLKDGMRTH
jgi:hypothetical protein